MVCTIVRWPMPFLRLGWLTLPTDSRRTVNEKCQICNLGHPHALLDPKKPNCPPTGVHKVIVEHPIVHAARWPMPFLWLGVTHAFDGQSTDNVKNVKYVKVGWLRARTQYLGLGLCLSGPTRNLCNLQLVWACCALSKVAAHIVRVPPKLNKNV